MQVMLLVPVVVAIVLTVIIYSCREMSQWKRVVEVSSPVPSPQSFEIFYLNIVIVNGLQFNGAIKIGIGDGGLFLQPIFPFSMAMPPVFISLKLLKPLNKMKYGLHLFSIEGTDLSIGISEKWSSKVSEGE